AIRAKLLQSRREILKDIPGRFPLAFAVCHDVPGEGRQSSEASTSRQPFANAGGSDARRDDTDGKVKVFNHFIAEQWNETSFCAACPGFRVIGQSPGVSIEGRDQTGLRILSFFAVICGI